MYCEKVSNDRFKSVTNFNFPSALYSLWMRWISCVLVSLPFSRPHSYLSHPECGSLQWDSICQDGHLQGRLALSVTAPGISLVSVPSPCTSAKLIHGEEAHTAEKHPQCYVTGCTGWWIGEIWGIFFSQSPERCYRPGRVMMTPLFQLIYIQTVYSHTE